MIEFQQIFVKDILHGVSLTAKKCSLTALIGRNGAGKSTLLSCAAGRKHSGEIFIEGKPISSMKSNERARLCALMPQSLPSPNVTVRELVSFGRTPFAPLSGKLNSADLSIVDEAIETVGLKDFRSVSVARLSGGERRKAFFAMTLAQNTPVLLLDEPAAYLDLRARFEFMELLEKIKKEKTVLAVLHELPQIMQYADFVYVIDGGKTAFSGNCENCIGEKIPEKYFGVALFGSREKGYSASYVQ